jgi:hypothetical protein
MNCLKSLFDVLVGIESEFGYSLAWPGQTIQEISSLSK